MAALSFFSPTFFILFFFLSVAPVAVEVDAAAGALVSIQPPPDLPKPNDTHALTLFRSGADAHGTLSANWTTPDACAGFWRGVGCSAGRVTSLSLPSHDLRGSLDPLSRLHQLRLLDLHDNRLNGTLLPLLSSLPNIKLLYLSSNDLSGEIPLAIGFLTRLLRIDLSDNNLEGPIPGDAFTNLTHLLTLRLQNNVLSGELPDLAATLQNLVQLNVSNNQLYGRVPNSVWDKFGMAAISGNAGLCGPAPLPALCPIIPRDSPPSISSSPSSQSVVPSNPSSADTSGGSAGTSGFLHGEERRVRVRLSTGAIISIVAGNITFFLLIFFLFVYFCCASQYLCENDGKVDAEEGRGEDNKGSSGTSFSNDDDEKRSGGKRKKEVRNSGESDDGSAAEAWSQLFFFHGVGRDEGPKIMMGNRREKKRERKFELEELLRASAEMLGRGSLGTVYRAALEDGEMVAVKRLKDANPCARKDFNKYMNLIGRLSHPNVVPLKAYYYAKQEKLLVYDYLPNGTLFSAIHGIRLLLFLVQKDESYALLCY